MTSRICAGVSRPYAISNVSSTAQMLTAIHFEVSGAGKGFMTAVADLGAKCFRSSSIWLIFSPNTAFEPIIGATVFVNLVNSSLS